MVLYILVFSFSAAAQVLEARLIYTWRDPGPCMTGPEHAAGVVQVD